MEAVTMLTTRMGSASLALYEIFHSGKHGKTCMFDIVNDLWAYGKCMENICLLSRACIDWPQVVT